MRLLYSLAIVVCFHTTQYDLNSRHCLTKCFFALGFHTTQYDLNQPLATIPQSQVFSFHTTQYDLNDINTKDTVTRQLFPYYIVRFKQNPYFVGIAAGVGFHTTQYDLNAFQFTCPFTTCRSFHTTQYDLNKIYFRLFTNCHGSFHTTQYDLNNPITRFYLFNPVLFPYYIVRFKQQSTSL